MKKHSTEINSGIQWWCLFLLFFIAAGSSYSQTAVVSGYVFNEQKQPLAAVNITANGSGTTTDSSGYFLLELVADKALSIKFTHLGHKDVVVNNIILKTNETFELNPIMATDAIQMAEVEVRPTGERNVKGILTVPKEVVRKIPGVNAGVENILKLLPGVSFNNELSTQYNVRGGNFDENLVYVNGIEVYRPFLIRSAQQEGFSFINNSLVESVAFVNNYHNHIQY